MMSLPLELYPRDTAMVRWAEILSDGIIELTPLPQFQQQKGVDQAPQGLVKMWKLPVLGEKGGGVGALGAGEDLSFTVTRKRFEIKAYCLPPMGEDDGGGEGGGKGEGRATKIDIEF
jgi:elongator complex protein 4